MMPSNANNNESKSKSSNSGEGSNKEIASNTTTQKMTAASSSADYNSGKEDEHVLDENHDESLMQAYALGQAVEAQDDRYSKDSKWYKGSVCEVDAKTKRVKVHFNGFHKKWDLWKSVSSKTLRKSSKPTSKRTSRTSVPSGGTPKKSKTPIKEQKPNVTTPNKATPAKTNTPNKSRAAMKPETPNSPSTSTRRSINLQTPVIKNPAEASPPPVQAAPANLDENNATTLAPAFFKTRKVMVDSVISTNSVEVMPVQSAKNAKMSPQRPNSLMQHDSVEEAVTNQRQPHSSSSIKHQTPSSSPTVEYSHAQNETPAAPPSAKHSQFVRETSKNDRELVEKMFGGLIDIANDGLLKCKVSGCTVSAHNPHMMMFHLDIVHPAEFKKTSIRIVTPATEQTKYQAITVHKGSVSQLDISVNCVCKSTVASGFLIRCASCEKWQHGNCISLSESNPPSIYLCFECIVKPDSAASSYKTVYVTTINENISASKEGSTSRIAKEVPAFVNAFTIGHSIDSYRSLLNNLRKRMDSTNLVDPDLFMQELKSLNKMLADQTAAKLDYQKLKKSFDNAILKI